MFFLYSGERMNNINAEDSLRHCKSCGKVFDLNDFDGPVSEQDFCSSECLAEFKQELADFRREEAEEEAAAKYPEEEDYEDMRADGDSLQDWVR